MMNKFKNYCWRLFRCSAVSFYCFGPIFIKDEVYPGESRDPLGLTYSPGYKAIKRMPLHPGPLKSIVVFYVFILASLSVSAQTNAINNDLQKININMFETRNLYMEVEYNLYFDQALRSQIKGIVKKDGRNLYQQVGSITVVKNKDYAVFVHEKDQLLVVDPNTELQDPIKKEDLLRINIDTLKSWILGSELTEQNNTRILSFTLKKGEYSRIRIEYDPVTYVIKKMQLYAKNMHTSVDDKQYRVWMEVVFTTISSGRVFSSEDFSIDKYIHIKNAGNVILTGNYRHYRLLNNLDKKIRYE